MAHSGVPGASLLSSNPSYNPLGTFGTLLPDIGAAAGEIAAPGNPFSTAVFLTKGGFDLSQGNILGGLGNFAGATLPFVLPTGAAGAAGTDAGTSAGSTAATASQGFGSSLSDFLSSPSIAGAGNVLSSGANAVGNTVSSGWNSLLNTLGLGSNAGGDLATVGSAAPGAASVTSLPSVSDEASLISGGAPSAPVSLLPGVGGTGAPGSITIPGAAPATTASDQNALLGLSPNQINSALTPGSISGGVPGTPDVPSLLDRLTGFTSAHPYLTLGATMAGSQLLSPLLQKIMGSGMTSQEKALLAAQQPAINAENQLISSEATGQLPPGAESAVSQALASDIANIKARYAALGMSGSSAEQQDIATAQAQSAANQFALTQQATQTGLSAAGITEDVYTQLVQNQLSRQQQLQNAFASLFSAIGYGTAAGEAKAAA